VDAEQWRRRGSRLADSPLGLASLA
jgi:hypothetical protein